jgi:hypothetical protein
VNKAEKKFFKFLPQAVGMVIASHKGTDREHLIFDHQYLVNRAVDLARRFIRVTADDKKAVEELPEKSMEGRPN